MVVRHSRIGKVNISVLRVGHPETLPDGLPDVDKQLLGPHSVHLFHVFDLAVIMFDVLWNTMLRRSRIHHTSIDIDVFILPEEAQFCNSWPKRIDFGCAHHQLSSNYIQRDTR